MIANSQIFTTTVFGNSSSQTVSEIENKNTSTIELVYQQQGMTKMNHKQPSVPTNQRIAKDKP
jgi:hypothetical protein